MSSLAWIGNRGSATGPTLSTSSSGASNSVVPAAKKSPGRRTLPNTAARSSVIMDIKPAGETLMGDVDDMASVPPRLPRAPTLSVTRDMSGFGSTRSVRFVPEGSHAAGGQNGPDHRCDWVASSEEVELRGGGGAVGDERAALSPAARRL